MVNTKEIIPRGDAEFIKYVLLPWSRCKAVYIAVSRSKKKWPDIWVEMRNGVPMITVTEEWRSHDTHLRRSQLVHEFIHIKGLEHGKYGKFLYSTHPAQDTYSKAIYEKMLKHNSLFTLKNPILYHMIGGKISEETARRALAIALTDKETKDNLAGLKEIKIVPAAITHGMTTEILIAEPDVVRISDKAVKSPEELACNFVHEGVHRAQIKSGKVYAGIRGKDVTKFEIEAYTKDIRFGEKLMGKMKPGHARNSLKRNIQLKTNYLKILNSILSGKWPNPRKYVE